MTTLAKRFGTEVRARRKARGLTQAQLSEAAHLSEEWVRRIERGVGTPSFDALEAMASALGASVADLFSPISTPDRLRVRIDAMLAGLDEAELVWIEGVVRASLARPARKEL